MDLIIAFICRNFYVRFCIGRAVRHTDKHVMSLRFCSTLYNCFVYKEGGLFRSVCLEIKE
jgi:hypothetical protein